MGFLKDIHSNLDIQAFPGARFEIAGDVPAAQCSEAIMEGTEGFILAGTPDFLRDPGAFGEFDPFGKYCTITEASNPIEGTYEITTHGPDLIDLHPAPGPAIEIHYFVHNGGEAILTRNVSSFAKYIRAAGYAYTIKGGKLYTNMPSELLKNACTILFDPLT